MRRRTVRISRKERAPRKPKFADRAYMGDEPASLGKKFNPTRMNVALAYNWYNYYFEAKDAKSWVLDFIKLGNQGKPPKQRYTNEQVKAFARVDVDSVPMWLGASVKMLMAGCPMPEGTFESIHGRIAEILNKVPPELKKQAEVVQIPVSKDLPAIAKFEEILDEFYRTNYKTSTVVPYDVLKEMNAKPSDAVALYNYYKPLAEEVTKAGEGYDHIPTRTRNRYLAFLSKILEDAKLYSSNMRKSSKVRKPRKRKVKTADQITSKVKFKTEDTKLKLVSQAPSTIVGATAVWLFNTKYRTLTYLEGQLSVKGTTIQGFDPKKSAKKKIRKPEILAAMMKLGKAATLKEFTKLKVKPARARGRINAETMILRVIK